MATKNKWGKAVDLLPKWDGDIKDEKTFSKVLAARKRFESLNLDHEDLALLIRARREEKDRMEEFAKDIGVEITAASQMLGDVMRDKLGVSSFTLPDGATAYLAPEPHISVVDKQQTREWAIEEGMEDLLAIPWQTLNAMAKDRLMAAMENGEPTEDLIPGTKLFIDLKVRVRKG